MIAIHWTRYMQFCELTQNNGAVWACVVESREFYNGIPSGHGETVWHAEAWFRNVCYRMVGPRKTEREAKAWCFKTLRRAICSAMKELEAMDHALEDCYDDEHDRNQLP